MDLTGEVRELLPSAAVMTDFDGTLAPIVDDPAAVAPAPGAVEVLSALAGRAGIVGVISGRPVTLLADHLPDVRIHLAGLYGIEHRQGGDLARVPEAHRWLAPVAAAARDLEREAPAGVTVEAKRVSITLHFRRRPEMAVAVRDLADDVAARHGLEARPARMAIEVHPLEAPDKGAVVEDLATGCDAACFLGDDIGDLPAFDALDRLAEKGVVTVKVAVRSPESAPELVDRADEVVDGTDGAVAWLRALL